jgi:hypothetical protein
MRRLIAVLAAVAAVPLLTLTAAAQSGGSKAALVADIRAQCPKEIERVIAADHAKLGKSIAALEAQATETLGMFVGQQVTEPALREMLRDPDIANEPIGGPFLGCVINARLAQLRNGDRPVGRPATASVPAPPDGTGGGSTAVYDHNGNLVRSTGGSGSAAAGSRGRISPRGMAMKGASGGSPVPDRNSCVQFIEQGPHGVCSKDDPSLGLRAVNSCPEVVQMQVCIYSTASRRWQCGSGTYGEYDPGKKNDTVLRGECQTDGRYLYAGCSVASRRNSSGGNCGGDPNAQGY